MTSIKFPTISFCISSTDHISFCISSTYQLAFQRPQDSIFDCRFDSRNCDYKDFESFNISLINANFFDACVGFNSGKNYSNQSSEIRNLSRTNIYTGLNLKFLLNDFIIDSFKSKTIYKLRVSIDNHTSFLNHIKIYDQKLGLDIPLGNTQIRINRVFH